MSKLVKIKYIQKVEHPRHRAGEIGDVKDVELSTARNLVREGFAELVVKAGIQGSKSTTGAAVQEERDEMKAEADSSNTNHRRGGKRADTEKVE